MHPKARAFSVAVMAALVFALLAGCSSGGGAATPTALIVTAPPKTPALQATATPNAAQPSLPPRPTVATAGQPADQAPAPTATPPPDFSATQSAASLPDPSAFEWRAVASGLSKPIGIAAARDGTNRMFVLEQAGLIRVFEAGKLADQPFLDIRDRVGSDSSERGLLGLAFHPNYRQNGFFYVNYTDKRGNTVIARFKVSDDPARADPGSELVMLQVEQPYANHNGGVVAFGPDGYLYLGLGDGGSAGDPENRAQSLNTLLGKILRLDVDHAEPYAIPANNPFVTQADARPEIWAYGLRNPWRFSFDRVTGGLLIADVGQNQWEEIDYEPAGTPGGRNYGWRLREALHEYKGQPPSGVELVDPVFEYSHNEGCSVTGGAVYRGQALKELNGVYLFGDYCSGKIWGAVVTGAPRWDGQVLFQTGYSITAFGEDEQGEVYLTDYNGNLVQLVRR